MLGADVHRDAIVGRGKGNAIFTQLSGDIGMDRAQSGFTSLRADRLQIGQRCRAGAPIRKDVVGCAVGASGHAHGMSRRIRRRQKRVVDVGVIEVLVSGLKIRRVVELRVRIVVPGLADLACRTQDRTIVRVLEVIDPIAALEIAPTDLDFDLVGRVQLIDGCNLSRRAAQNADLLRAQERIAAVHMVIAGSGVVWIAAAKQCRGRDLLLRPIVHEVELQVRLDPVLNIDVGVEAGQVPGVIPLHEDEGLRVVGGGWRRGD